MRLRFLAPVVGLLALWSCTRSDSATAPHPTAEPKKDPAPKASQTPKGKAALPRPEGKSVSFDRQLAHVAELRGLPPKAPVEGLAVTRAALQAHVERALLVERPENVLLGTELMLAGLGLVPVDFNFEETLLELLGENLAGLYEPRLKLMLVRSDLPEQLAQVTLAHELVHALQDQYFDLQEIVEFHEDDSDLSSALSCLAEGDATSLMIDEVAGPGKTALDLPESSIIESFFSQPPTTKAPPLIVASLYAPYIDGLVFVHKLRRRGGFKEVDKVFRSPPTTTEQILHLDKYDSHEPGVSVPLVAPPRPEYKEVLHDIWGEQSLRLALELTNDAATASQAAAGWGGDRIVSYQNGSKFAVAWHVVMDSQRDADELWKAATVGATRLDTNQACRTKRHADHDQDVAVTTEIGPAVLMIRAEDGMYFLSSGWARDGLQNDCSQAQGWQKTLGI